MKLSARNIIKGKIVSLTTGATTTQVKLEVAAGFIITSSITNEAATDLGLTIGKDATAIVKSSDVIIGVD